HDLLALATTNFDARDWQVWLVRDLGQGATRPERLALRLDPRFLPAFSNGVEASLTWTGDAADVDGDGRDEVVWVMSKTDYAHCGIVVLGASPGAEELIERTSLDLDEPCALADVKLTDVDGDGARDILLLTGAIGGGDRTLKVLWNQGQGQFSTSVASVLSASTEHPKAFTFLRPIPGRATSIAYITETALHLAQSNGQRRFTARTLTSVVRGTGLVAADINGDQSDDLIVAASGNLFTMTAQLRIQ
ncbi:MAG: VCBS repeat-containing protein, partial [Polyangiaceae bacterium]